MHILKQLIIIEVIVLSIQTLTYYGAELLQHNLHDVKRPFDDKVPLKPKWVYVYSLWFPLIFIYPITMYYCSKESYVIYMTAVIVSDIIGIIVYIAYPTTFKREHPGGGFFGKSLSFVYFFDFRGYNCAPSMHCFMCFIMMGVAILCPELAIVAKIAIAVLCCAIVAATQFTKQHVIIDMITAIPVAVAALIIGYTVNSVYGTQVLLSILGL